MRARKRIDVREFCIQNLGTSKNKIFCSYHEKVAYDPPELEIQEKTFGLVSPEPFEMPNTSPLWTANSYAAFDISANATSGAPKGKQVSALKIHIPRPAIKV